MRSENFPVGSPAPRGGKSRAQGHDISANEIQIAESGNTASSQQLCGASADPGGVPKFKDIGRAMATRSASLLMEEDGLGSALSQALQSCPEVLSTIYTAHHRRVLQVCRRFFRHPEDAEDAAAEVFLKLHRVLEKKDEASSFPPWLAQVAGRHCIDKLRRGKWEKNSCVAGTDLSEVPDNSTPSPLSQILRSEEHRQVREQLIRLPEKYKVPLFLRYYKRMSYSEIARTLNRRLPAVRMMIFRAKDQLGQNLLRLERSQVAPGLSADGLWTKTKMESSDTSTGTENSSSLPHLRKVLHLKPE